MNSTLGSVVPLAMFIIRLDLKSGSKRASDVLHWINTWIPRTFWSIVQKEIVKVLSLEMFHPEKGSIAISKSRTLDIFLCWTINDT